MEKESPELTAEYAALLDLGVVLGENLAFSLMAGRCSAAQAATLKRIREEKNYQKLVPHWRDFCPKYLKMSRAQADKIIGLLDEFGPGYFELAQLTRISPQTYRAIEPSIEDGALHCNGEVIELDPENSQRVAAAVAELRRALPPRPAPELTIDERLAALERRSNALLEEFAALDQAGRAAGNWPRYRAMLAKVSEALAQFGLEEAA